jgi:hypothetical protein
MARVRCAIAAARQTALIDGLGRWQPRRARAERCIGLPPGLRERCRTAEATVIPALCEALAAADGEDEHAPWLLAGASGGALAALLWQVRPAAPVVVLPSDGDEAVAGRFLGCHLLAADQLAELPPRLGGLVLTPAGLRLGLDPTVFAKRLPTPGVVVVATAVAEVWAAAIGRAIGRQWPSGLTQLVPCPGPPCAR